MSIERYDQALMFPKANKGTLMRGVESEGDYSEQNTAVGTKRKFLSNTTDNINEVKKYLAKSYKKKYSKISLILAEKEKKISTDKLFTNLVLIPEEEHSSAEKLAKNDKLEDARETSWSKLHTSQNNISLDELFVPQQSLSKKKNKNRKVKRVLVLGEAGIGKSTLCHKLSLSWAKRNINEIIINNDDDNVNEEQMDLILLIPLQMLNPELELKKEGSIYGEYDTLRYLVQLITKIIIRKTEWEEDLFGYIKNYSKKVLLILDGYDECSLKLRNFINQILEEEFEWKILVTSRAGAADNIYKYFDQRFKSLGFTDQQMENYSSLFFNRFSENKFEKTNKSIMTENFISKLKEKQSLYEMAHVPLILQMICRLWEIGEEDDNIKKLFQENSTLTDLYRLIVNTLIKWEGEKYNEIKGNNRILRELGKIAENGLSRGELMIPCLNLKEKEDLIKTGLIKVVGEDLSIYYYFQHLSIQEYLITRKFIPQSISPFSFETMAHDNEFDKRESIEMNREIINFVKENKDNRNYRLAIQFLAGELYFFCKKAENCWSSLDLFFDSLCDGLLVCSVEDAEERIRLILKCINECPPINETWNYHVNSFTGILDDHHEISIHFRDYVIKEGMLHTMSWLLSHYPLLGNYIFSQTHDYPIIQAVKKGHLEMAILFFSKYPKYGVKGIESVIISAIRSGNVSIFNWLFDKNHIKPLILFSTEQNWGVNPLRIAVHTKLAMAKRVYELFPRLLHQNDEGGNNCLFYATRSKQLPMVEWVFEKENAQLIHKNNKGESLLQFACNCMIADDEYDWKTNIKPMLEWIYEKDNDLISSIDNEGNTVAHTAASVCNFFMLKWIHEKSPALLLSKIHDGRNILHHMIYKFADIFISRMKPIIMGLDWINNIYPTLINDKDNENNTTMHYAILTATPIPILEWLFKQNQIDQMHAKNSSGYFPLDIKWTSSIEKRGGNVTETIWANEDGVLCWLFEHYDSIDFQWERYRTELLPCFWSDKDGIREKWLSLHGPIEADSLIREIMEKKRLNKEELAILLKQNINYSGGKLLFHIAIPYHNLSILNLLFEIIPNSSGLLLYIDEEGKTVWHSACDYPSRDIQKAKDIDGVLNWLWVKSNEVRELIKNRDNEGRTALHIAAERKDKNLIEWLVKRDKDLLKISDNNARNALQLLRTCIGSWKYLWEFHKEYKPIVEYLLAQDKQMLFHKDNDGYVFIDYLVYLSDELTLEWLLNLYPELLSQISFGNVYCYDKRKFFQGFRNKKHYLYRWKKDKTGGIIKVLERVYPKFTQIDKRGNTVLHNAVIEGNIHLVKYFIKEKPNLIYVQNMRKFAPFQCNLSFMELFLKKEKGDRILSLLHKDQLFELTKIAVFSIKFSLLKRLHNFDPCLIFCCDTKTSRNLLHILLDNQISAGVAQQKLLKEMMKWIYEQDKSLLDQVDKNGNTVLHYAARNINLQLMKWIYKRNESLINSVNIEGLSILHAICGSRSRYFNVKVIEWICSIQEDLLYKPDKNGRIPLHLAVINFQLEEVKWMVENSQIDLTEIKDNQNRNVLHYAAMGNNIILFEYLRDKDEKLNLVNDIGGFTPQLIWDNKLWEKNCMEDSSLYLDDTIYKLNPDKEKEGMINNDEEVNFKNIIILDAINKVKDFLEKIINKLAIPDDIKQMADECTRKLVEEVKIQLSVKDLIVSGSYSRGTAIHPFNDIDLLVVLHNAYFRPEFEELPREHLSWINENLAELDLSLENIRIQNKSVGFKYKDFQFDIVPAFSSKNKENSYQIPDVNCKEWIETSPFLHSKALEDLNNDTRGLAKKVIKLIKYWIRQHKLKYEKIPMKKNLYEIKSFIIERLIVNNVELNQKLKDYANKSDQAMVLQYSLLASFDCLRVEIWEPEANIKEVKSINAVIVGEYKNIIAACKAEEKGDYSTSLSLWKKIFLE